MDDTILICEKDMYNDTKNKTNKNQLIPTLHSYHLCLDYELVPQPEKFVKSSFITLWIQQSTTQMVRRGSRRAANVFNNLLKSLLIMVYLSNRGEKKRAYLWDSNVMVINERHRLWLRIALQGNIPNQNAHRRMWKSWTAASGLYMRKEMYVQWRRPLTTGGEECTRVKPPPGQSSCQVSLSESWKHSLTCSSRMCDLCNPPVWQIRDQGDDCLTCSTYTSLKALALAYSSCLWLDANGRDGFCMLCFNCL